MSGQYHVVILDEINVAMSFGLVDTSTVLDLLTANPRMLKSF